MRSADRFHSPAPEELMEYVDGEGSAASRAAIEAHLASCAACQAIVAEQRRLTTAVHAWHVAPAPASLQPRQAATARPWWRPSPTIAAGLAAAAAVLVIGAINQRAKSPSVMTIGLGGGRAASAPTVTTAVRQMQQAAPSAPESVAQDRASGGLAGLPPRSGLQVPSVIRTARLQIVIKNFATARDSVESIVSAGGGFIDHMTVSGDTSQARVLRGTLRVRSDRFSDVLTRLRGLGVALEDTQGTQDVTDQIVDLEARLAGSRATEQRLAELVRNRTGRLSDVLEVERELTRVRVEIERLDAERTNMTRRVTYATVDVTITEERKVSIDGPVSLITRLKVAALDGLESALDSFASIVLFVLRAGPSLALWGGLAAVAWLTIRRIRDSRSAIQDPR